MKDVLRCLQEAGLKLNLKKCEFNKLEVEFLRYIMLQSVLYCPIRV